LLAESLPSALVSALRAHNGAHPDPERIRLRMALHAGEVRYDQHGVTAAAVNLAFRLLAAAALKAALASSPGVLAVIASSWFFEEVVRHSTADAAAHRPVEVAVKETTTTGSIYLPDHMDPAAGRCWSTCPLWPQCRAASRLHDLLREYAQARAAADDAAENQATVGRLLDYYPHTAMTASRYTAWRTSITGPPPPGLHRPGPRTCARRTRPSPGWGAERAILHACAGYAAAHECLVHAVWIPVAMSGFPHSQVWPRGIRGHVASGAIIARAFTQVLRT
jgi:hypothetical protein